MFFILIFTRRPLNAIKSYQNALTKQRGNPTVLKKLEKIKP